MSIPHSAWWFPLRRGRFRYLCQRERIFLPPTSTWTCAGLRDVAAPTLDVAGIPPARPRGSGDQWSSRAEVYLAVGMGGQSAGTDLNGGRASVSWRFCTREAERDRPWTRDRGRFLPHPAWSCSPPRRAHTSARRSSRAPTFSEKPSGKTEPPAVPHRGRFSCVALSAGKRQDHLGARVSLVDVIGLTLAISHAAIEAVTPRPQRYR